MKNIQYVNNISETLHITYFHWQVELVQIVLKVHKCNSKILYKYINVFKCIVQKYNFITNGKSIRF